MMSDELAKAVVELLETYEFCMSISALPGEEIVKRIDQNYPEYLACVKNMDEPPTNPIDLWTGFCIFCVTCLQKKYEPIWDDVSKAYFSSDARKEKPQKPQLADLIWKQIEETFSD